MGIKFTTKFWCVKSGDGVKKPILRFKEDHGDRYECYQIQYDHQISIYFFQPEKFLTLVIFTLFSVDLCST